MKQTILRSPRLNNMQGDIKFYGHLGPVGICIVLVRSRYILSLQYFYFTLDNITTTKIIELTINFINWTQRYSL